MSTTGPHAVTHRLKVTRMVCLACEEIVAEGLSALDGMISVRAEWRGNVVTVTYDLFRMRFSAVEKLLTEIGFPPDPGFFYRKRRDWLRFAEQNELDGLRHRAACCSKPPARIS